MYLMGQIPMATEEQLLMFFGNETNEVNMSDLIRALIKDRRLIRQVQSGEYEVITVIRPIRFTKRAVQEFLDAFWVVANMGSEQVRYIQACNNATKYIVIMDDESSTTYDITCCQTPEDARVGLIFRDPVGDEDFIGHIALCYSKEAGDAMKPQLRAYGYDMFCVVDPETHLVTYYDIGD